MVSRGMKRYRQRSDAQAGLVGPSGGEAIEPVALFGRRAPLRLEIGFGHGEFITALAATHPDEDHIGLEHNPLRVTKTAHKCRKLGLDNVRLFDGDARELLARLPTASIHRCYVLFPDPWPKMRHRRRRLLSREFLLGLARVLVEGGRFIMASDCHEYVMATLTNSTLMPGIWHNAYAPDGYRFAIPTRFPTLFQRYKEQNGERICHLMLRRSAQSVRPPANAPRLQQGGF